MHLTWCPFLRICRLQLFDKRSSSSLLALQCTTTNTQWIYLVGTHGWLKATPTRYLHYTFDLNTLRILTGLKACRYKQ